MNDIFEYEENSGCVTVKRLKDKHAGGSYCAQ